MHPTFPCTDRQTWRSATLCLVEAGVAPVLELAPSIVEEWHRLSICAVEPNPFLAPGNIIPAASNLPGGNSAALAYVRDGGGLQAAMVVRPLADRAGLRVLTSRPFIPIEVATPLLAPGASPRTLELLLRALATDGGASILALEFLGTGGPVSKGLLDAAANLRMPSRTYKTWSRPLLSRQGTVACEQSTCNACRRCRLLAPKRAVGFTRWRHGVQRRFGHEPVFTEHPPTPEWTGRFLALEASGWKGREKPGEGAMVNRPGYREWFQESSSRMAGAALSHLFSLSSGEQILAMFYVLEAPGRALFAHRMCYEEAFKPQAPGVQLLLESVRYFLHDTQAEFFDSCALPGNPHFSEFFPGQRSMANVAMAMAGLASRAAVRVLPACAPVLRTLREGAVAGQRVLVVS